MGVEFKELHTYYPDTLQLPVFCPLKEWMVWIKRPSVCLKIAGGGEDGKRGPSFLAGYELMLFQACIIGECYGGLFLIINSPQVVRLKVGHFSMPEGISQICGAHLFVGGICGEQIRRSGEGLGHQADKHRYPCPKPF